MITIVHGEDQIASRNYLLELKSKALSSVSEVLTLDGSDISKEDLVKSISTQSLFSESKLIILEKLLSRRPSNLKDELIDFLFIKNDKENIILYEDKQINLPKIAKDKSIVKLFSLPSNIFVFLDNPNIKNLHQAEKSAPIELIFALFTSHIRKIIISFDTGASSQIPSWQLTKLKKITKNTNADYWIELYKKLLNIDYKVKTSETPLGLEGELELVVNTIENRIK